MKQIIINANVSETRIALLEKNVLVELFVERHAQQNILGSVYFGRVIRVIPGMQSAFIDIGEDRAGFLYSKDVVSSGSEEWEDDDHPYPINRQPIEKQLKEGQMIVVQVAKESYGSKGPRLTMGVAIPGRYLVLLPSSSHIGISRKIEDEKERKRLRKLIDDIRDTDCGIIVRTAANKVEQKQLECDIKYLSEIWNKIRAACSERKTPTLLHVDFSIVSRIARDVYTEDVKIVVDDNQCYQEILSFFKRINQPTDKVELYGGYLPIFDIYGIEQDIELALQARVDLSTGGFVVIEETEALTTFDVNTGKYVGRKSADETIVKTNIEALNTITTQIRLRNIAGIIVIDFIDMNNAADREEVYQTLLKQLKYDKAKTNVLRVSDFGLVQITRKRTRESLEKTLTTTCYTCKGRGYVKSKATIANEMFRAIRRIYARTKVNKLKLKIREDFYQYITAEEMEHLHVLQQELDLQIEFASSPYQNPIYHLPPFQIS